MNAVDCYHDLHSEQDDSLEASLPYEIGIYVN